MVLDDDFVAKLVCPRTRQPLHRLSEPDLTRWNQAIVERRVHVRGGELVERSLSAALGPDEAGYCYRVDGDIPILLIEEALELDSQ